MHLLVFQHSAGEPPAAFGEHAKIAGDEVTVVRLFEGARIPKLNAYDGLLVMGGPMDVWDIDTHPWLTPEIAAIKEWVDTGKPYLGICLGHQLLAEATGGTCARMAVPEIAVADVRLFDAEDPIAAALPQRFLAMHWHGVEVKDTPENTVVLGRSAGCANQFMRVGENAWGLQFHPELQSGTITQWMQDSGNVACASDWLGSEAEAWEFVEASEQQVESFLERSRAIYQRFRALC